jgi:anti-sigma factor RsiW
LTENIRRTAPLAPGRSRWNIWGTGSAGFGLGAAVAAALLLTGAAPTGQPLMDEVVAGHLRSLQPGHLMDVVSTDRHTVKPWFDGKLDFAPPVKDLADQGFPLQGGRLDYAHGRPVAALVYGRAKHTINLFIWPEAGQGAAETTAARNGYTVVHLNHDGMNVWAVSDVEKPELLEFMRLWQNAP